MHSHIMPPKLALNSCCSLKCNAFTLCIHTRAGCLGDAQNGRTYVTKKCREEWRRWKRGGMEVNRCVGVCDEEREHKKQMEDEWEETRHCYSTYKDCSGQVHQRVQNTKNTANMHRQWEANSQNRVAMTQPRYRTQTSYILTVSLQPHCLLERSSIAHFSCSTQKQGQWTVM